MTRSASTEQLPARLHGRRLGRPLRTGHRWLIAQRLPEAEIHLPVSGGFDPLAAFPARPSAVWLEIGFGAGEHLAWQAARHPEVGFIGCEIYLNGIATLLRACEEDAIRNVRIFREDARLLLAELPEASLQRVFVLFPDPWPKRRHHKRRLIDQTSLDHLARALADDAELRLATDHTGYQAWMLRHLLARREFEWLAERADDWRDRPEDWPATRYEAKARAGGRQPVFLRFRRRRRNQPKNP